MGKPYRENVAIVLFWGLALCVLLFLIGEWIG
jgi:hypothetical protein